MMTSWWWMWMLVMLVFLLPPVSYGWGYRGWGPPYPTYVQRRRSQQASATGGAAGFNHHSWGRGGDLVWGAFFIGLLFACSTYWWR